VRIEAVHNIAPNLNAVTSEYQRLTGLSDFDVLTKQGGKLAYNVKRRLRATAPAKGAIREEVLARVRGGRGVKIRAAAYSDAAVAAAKALFKEQKRLRTRRPGAKQFNYGQQLIRREIGFREKGRRALSISISYPRTLPVADQSRSRYGDVLSAARVTTAAADKKAQVTWQTSSPRAKSIEAGVRRPRGQMAIRSAVRETHDDIVVYTTRKKREAVEKAIKKAVGRSLSGGDWIAKAGRLAV
jgi:hypothetical protein